MQNRICAMELDHESKSLSVFKDYKNATQTETLYILDEPTTGLHFHDINQLLNVLHTLKKKGNTIVVIEHNLDVIKTADWIIDEEETVLKSSSII